MTEMSDDFALDSNGFFKGCVGAIDGLAVRIRRPVGVADAGNYFCRKNFTQSTSKLFAINRKGSLG